MATHRIRIGFGVDCGNRIPHGLFAKDPRLGHRNDVQRFHTGRRKVVPRGQKRLIGRSLQRDCEFLLPWLKVRQCRRCGIRTERLRFQCAGAQHLLGSTPGSLGRADATSRRSQSQFACGVPNGRRGARLQDVPSSLVGLCPEKNFGLGSRTVGEEAYAAPCDIDVSNSGRRPRCSRAP